MGIVSYDNKVSYDSSSVGGHGERPGRCSPLLEAENLLGERLVYSQFRNTGTSNGFPYVRNQTGSCYFDCPFLSLLAGLSQVILTLIAEHSILSISSGHNIVYNTKEVIETTYSVFLFVQ